MEFSNPYICERFLYNQRGRQVNQLTSQNKFKKETERETLLHE
jgi:hypothetical protein